MAINLPLLELGCENPHCQDKSHSERRDSFVLDILLALVESSYTSLPLSGGSGGGGRDGKGKGKARPGWGEVESFRKEARYWHEVWKKEKRPNTGWLHSTMVKWKRQYHYAVRRAKGKSNHVRAEKFFEASMSGDLDLMMEMKKIRTEEIVRLNFLTMLVVEMGQMKLLTNFGKYIQLCTIVLAHRLIYLTLGRRLEE